MSTSTPTFTPETARRFDRYSVANAVTLKEALPCGCEPYVDVFTYRRWKAQGFQVQRGEHGVKLTTWISYEREDKDGTVKTYTRPKTTTVFCRCQVAPLERN